MTVRRFFALALSFAAGFLMASAIRPHGRALAHTAQRDGITVNFPNPDRADLGRPRLTRHLTVTRFSDQDGEHDVESATDKGEQWVITMGPTTYRAVESGE